MNKKEYAELEGHHIREDEKLTKLFKKDELICPESKRTWYSEVARCNLNDKYCLLETGDTCPYYEEYLEEENQ